jgi:hypothetical protein
MRAAHVGLFESHLLMPDERPELVGAEIEAGDMPFGFVLDNVADEVAADEAVGAEDEEVHVFPLLLRVPATIIVAVQPELSFNRKKNFRRAAYAAPQMTG